MLRQIIFLLICSLTQIVSGQIILQNPNFIGDESGSVCECPYWNTCNSNLATGGSSVSIPGYPNTTFQSDSLWLFLYTNSPNGYYGLLSQRLNCSFKKNRTYHFSIGAASYYYKDGGYVSRGSFSIYGANVDSCDTTEFLNQSKYLDFEWEIQQLYFTPKQDDYSIFIIRTTVDTISGYLLLLDSLSPIYPHNGNAVHIQNITDTTIQPGACVQLQATADITTYDTIFWLKKYQVQDGFRTDTIRNTFTLNDCPISSTTYIIALRDSVPDCAGIWWSYDTVRVIVNTGTAISNLSVQENIKAKLYPNPLNTSILNVELPQSGTLEVISVIGQIVSKSNVSEGLNEMNLSNISKGNYIVKTTYANGEVDIQKLTITK